MNSKILKNSKHFINCKKWLLLNNDIAKEYDKTLIICKNCSNYALPYFIHSEIGDYTCYICNKDGDVKNYCVYCKKN
jgi:hypothetical protein